MESSIDEIIKLAGELRLKLLQGDKPESLEWIEAEQEKTALPANASRERQALQDDPRLVAHRARQQRDQRLRYTEEALRHVEDVLGSLKGMFP